MQDAYTKILALFACHFSPRVWGRSKVLITGAILARGQRAISSVPRVKGLCDEPRFRTFHRVLSRAVWSAPSVSKTLLLLVRTFLARGELVIGGDVTIERRRGAKIAAKGIYRDPSNSLIAKTPAAIFKRFAAALRDST